jgi:predicted transcriptional regulator
MNAITVHLPDETAARLDRLADKLSKPADSVAADAIEDFLAREEWQLAEIEAGLAEADRGEFATEDEVNAVFAKYGVTTHGA